MSHSSLPLGQYLQFKVFEFFRDRFWPFILPYTPQSKLSDSHPFEIDVNTIMKHLFMATEELSRKKSFNVTGAESPFICFWSTSPLEWIIENGGYGTSILARDFEYLEEDPDNPGLEIKKVSKGFLQDYKFSFEIFSSSYYKDFREKLNFNLLELDRLRSVPISLTELFPSYKTKIELLLKGIKFKDTSQTETTSRSFSLSASYEARMTIATRIHSEDSLMAVNLYLNGSKIWTSLT